VIVTSAGIVAERPSDASFVLITSALRDEGTSLHYLPQGDVASVDESLCRSLVPATADIGVSSGVSWTTDAPFRETASAIEAARRRGALCVEMEAAALYAFAEARKRRVACVAHLTNTMGQREGDFEKGDANGQSRSALRIR
jgi:uridine phosphorylase